MKRSSAADLFLSAIYYQGAAEAVLQQQSEWTYMSLKRSLKAASENGDEKYFNCFKVRGMQPRIAELAFHKVFGRVRGADVSQGLCDLNAECIASVVPPWKLASRPNLPAADWKDREGPCYDVKCNLRYPSNQTRIGLRGFLIRLKQPLKSDCSYPCFVFTDATTSESCEWVYVGAYRPKVAVNDHVNDRVLPFYCRLPNELRFVLPGSKTESYASLPLLQDFFLRLGWQVVIGQYAGPRQDVNASAQSLFEDFVERCVRMTANTFLEHALWKALTEATFDARARCDQDVVIDFLKLAEEWIADRSLPVHLPRINHQPILCLWIDDVLKPLVKDWNLIRCPSCNPRATHQWKGRLDITRMTSEGAIYGRMTCGGCGHRTDNVTVLTHCHNCGHYPLVIGKNPLCAGCKGLVCNWHRRETDTPCGTCKKNCQHPQATTGREDRL